MSALDRTKIQEPFMGRSHVVILGAGASFAAFPNGDKNGHKLPLMWNIVDVLGLGPLLDEAGITEHRDNFERLYSDLVAAGLHADLVTKIDQAIFDYFAGMELPEEPTLYDHLVLSLRNKDIIATFNWDPFLVQAVARNGDPKTLPNLLFLHGNTAIGYCLDHKPIRLGNRGHYCPVCGKPFQDSRLLYPVGEKDYNKDPFIAKGWEVLHHYLKSAYVVTTFGYSAPTTDVEAVGLLKSAWGDPQERELEEIEIIDIKDEEILYQTWEPFIHTHHYQTTSSFYESIIGRSPRRSCEAMWTTLMEAVFIDANPVPRDASWEELREFYTVLLEDEQNHPPRT
jgi:hypothetical protein